MILSVFSKINRAVYADWLNDPIAAEFSAQVQDAFSTPGAAPTSGPNEITAFAAIGYQIVPEPSSLTMLGTAAAFACGFGWKCHTRRDRKNAA